MRAASFEYFVNFALEGISLLLIGYVVLRQVIANNFVDTSKTEQEVQTNKGVKFLKKLWCCVGGSITRQFGFIN